jgi:ribosomal-protein-serine acetyltransferase
MFKIEIEPDLSLQLLHLNQAKAIFELGVKNKDDFTNWLPWIESNKTIEDSKAFIVKELTNYAKGRGVICSIVYKNKIIGNISLFNIAYESSFRNAEIGYWLDKDYQGKGIMTKAANKMVEIAFNQFGVYKVTIRCATANNKSCNIAKRLGFKKDGTIRAMAKIGGIVQDFNVYSLLESEWQDREKLKAKSLKLYI